MKKIKGISGSPGIAIGKARKLNDDFLSFKEVKKIKDKDVDEEIKRFRESINKTENEILEIINNIKKITDKEYAEIFSFHISIIRDKNLMERIEKIIKSEKVTAETAIKKFIDKLNKEFPENSFKTRKKEILDIFERIVSNLSRKNNRFKNIKDGILVSNDLSPTQTVSIDTKYIKGFVTSMGTETSHTVIIAKALEIPAVVGIKESIEQIKEDDTLLIDGYEGIVIVNPTENEIEKIKLKEKEIEKLKKKIYTLKSKKATTSDGKEIKLYANIQLPEEVEAALKYGAEGIGLFRTEYLYLKRKDLPTEEEQFLSYKKIIEKFGKKEIIIRTIDVGGDKFISAFEGPKELNSFLGLRGIRFCLEKKDIFLTQIRAILRASYYGDLKIMFPMITTKEEVIKTKKIIEEAKKELKKENLKFNENIKIGIMIETPSAALVSDDLAKEVDFFSIGSNDLIQYTLAIDRVNEKLSYLYQPCHPSVLNLIRITVENAIKNNIKISLCGEMASIPEIACLLIGLGIDELSMAPVAIPSVKEKILKNSYVEIKKIVEKVMNFDSHEKIINFIKNNLK
ncbi:MAG: phosphoenolpyruvate--protein phosphotransferase [Candidatus Omnitrophica bacterium]|nr:phosphoenolpyruvate--protein phosphotransferase [Candidatus Omnitrophota bacterium]MCM8803029.1 phosphoenolpyruvate--protein phosphotransferase [Candidatus Omnitrophota bacterium]